MSNMGTYEQRYKDFDWKISEEELQFGIKGPINIGYFCSDRICEQRLGKKLALIWEGFTGEVKKFTYDDIRLHSNAFAQFFLQIGLLPQDRICLFMDRIQELY